MITVRTDDSVVLAEPAFWNRSWEDALCGGFSTLVGQYAPCIRGQHHSVQPGFIKLLDSIGSLVGFLGCNGG